MSFSTLPSKNKFFSAAVAGLLAVTIAGTAMTSEAHAGKRGKWIALGVGAGILGTAIVANERRRARERRYHRRTAWERHVARCYRAYRSYDEYTDTWIDRRGRERICRL